MATFNLNITVPDGEVTRLRDALRWMFAEPTLTAGQAQERMRLHVISLLKGTVKRYERHVGRETVEAGLVEIGPT